jgi:MFS family permease
MRLGAAVTACGLLLALASGWLPGLWRSTALALAAVAVGAGANIGMIAIQRTGGLVARDAVDRVRVFSWLAIAPSVGNMVGPVAAGVLIDLGGFSAAYAALLALPLLSVAAARGVPAGAAPGARAPAGGSALTLLALPGMKRLLVVNALLSMCWDVHAFAVPILGHGHGFSATTIGLVLGSFTLSVTGVRLVIPSLAERMQPQAVVPGAMLVTAAVFVVYPWAATPWAMAGCAMVLGLALGCVQPMMMSVLHQLTPAHRHGQALAFRSMTINGSSTVMPLIFGAGGAVFGAAVLFWAVGALVGSGAALARGLRT